MHIALIGPGIIAIPPPGWGAVEILIWDYYQELVKQGHTVVIINTPDIGQILNSLHEGDFDFIHLHYDVFCDILFYIKTIFPRAKVAITSHYPYIDDSSKYKNDGYDRVFNMMIENHDFCIMPISQRDYDVFYRHAEVKENVVMIESGASSKAFNFEPIASYDNTICLGKIEPRKRQASLQDLVRVAGITGVHFVGNVADSAFNTTDPNYLGEWQKDKLYKELTKYTNLILLSENENGYPLVVKEALVAGLGVVVSENSVDTKTKTKKDIILPEFITVIPNEQIANGEYIKNAINKNKEVCRGDDMRDKIRAYGIATFGYERIVSDYIDKVDALLLKV